MQPPSPGRRAQRLASFLVLFTISGLGHAQRTPPGSKPVRGKTSPDLVQAQQLMQQGQLEQARGLIEDQLKLTPSNLEALNLLGIVETSGKDFSQAEAAFQQALRSDPGSTETHNNLGNLYVAE